MLVEKHRPDDFDQIIGQDENIEKIKTMIRAKKNIPHILFVGPAGTGKTTAAYCICKEIFGDTWRRRVQIYNASSTRGIDTVRGPITRLVNMRGKRIIFLDEFDNFTNDAQEAMRGLMEKASRKDVRFILTGNNENKIIKPIQSRCLLLRFRKLSDYDVQKRVLDILIKEGISKTEIKKHREAIKKLIKESHGDLRKAITQIESILNEDGALNIKNITITSDNKLISSAFIHALDGDFDKAQQAIEDSFILNRFSPDEIINEFHTQINETIGDKTIKIRLFYELSKIAHRCKSSATPLVHLIAFIAYVWIVKYLPNGCPIKESSDD